MPSYKVCYFDSPGLGQSLRLMFADAGVAFEDERYKHEDWPKHKPGTNQDGSENVSKNFSFVLCTQALRQLLSSEYVTSLKSLYLFTVTHRFYNIYTLDKIIILSLWCHSNYI